MNFELIDLQAQRRPGAMGDGGGEDVAFHRLIMALGLGGEAQERPR